MTSWRADKNSLQVVGFGKAVVLEVVPSLLDLFFVASSRSSMRLSIESNPSSTLAAVTFVSLAAAMLSAASSLVSVRVAARESSSDTEAVVDSRELLDHRVVVNVVEVSVGDRDGDEGLDDPIVVSEVVDPELDMVVDPSVDDSSVLVVKSVLVDPTDPVSVFVDPVDVY